MKWVASICLRPILLPRVEALFFGWIRPIYHITGSISKMERLKYQSDSACCSGPFSIIIFEPRQHILPQWVLFHQDNKFTRQQENITVFCKLEICDFVPAITEMKSVRRRSGFRKNNGNLAHRLDKFVLAGLRAMCGCSIAGETEISQKTFLRPVDRKPPLASLFDWTNTIRITMITSHNVEEIFYAQSVR